MNDLLLQPSLEEFRALAGRGNLIPVYTDLVADAETPVSAFQKLDRGGYSFLLESAEPGGERGRFSFVGSNPKLIVESRGRWIRVREGGQIRDYPIQDDPLHELQRLMAGYQLVPPEDKSAFPAPFTAGRSATLPTTW